MSIRRFVELGAFGSVCCMLTANPAAASCRDERKPCDAAAVVVCCDPVNDPIAEAVLIPRLPESRPTRESLVVWFTKPVKVGTQVLMGKYVIEHDDGRMARGEPCTYIYAAADRQTPVVTFHCTHVDRPRGEQASVTVRPMGEANGMGELREFQFAGELGAHAFPSSR